MSFVRDDMETLAPAALCRCPKRLAGHSQLCEARVVERLNRDGYEVVPRGAFYREAASPDAALSAVARAVVHRELRAALATMPCFCESARPELTKARRDWCAKRGAGRLGARGAPTMSRTPEGGPVAGLLDDEHTYRRVVAEHLAGRAPERAVAMLEAAPARWRAALADRVEALNASLTTERRQWEAWRSRRRDPREYREAKRAYDRRTAATLAEKAMVESQLRRANLLVGGRNGSGRNDWRRLARWLLAEFTPDELDGLWGCVPDDLRHVLEVADRDQRGTVGDTTEVA